MYQTQTRARTQEKIQTFDIRPLEKPDLHYSTIKDDR